MRSSDWSSDVCSSDLSESIGTTFTYGGEFYRDVQDGASASGEREGVPDADSTFYGLFAQAEIAAAEPFGVLPGDMLIIPGLRFDSNPSSSALAAINSDHAVSPRIALTYMLSHWFMAFYSYSQAFSSPPLAELYLSGPPFHIPDDPAVVTRSVIHPPQHP